MQPASQPASQPANNACAMYQHGTVCQRAELLLTTGCQLVCSALYLSIAATKLSTGAMRPSSSWLVWMMMR